MSQWKVVFPDRWTWHKCPACGLRFRIAEPSGALPDDEIDECKCQHSEVWLDEGDVPMGYVLVY